MRRLIAAGCVGVLACIGGLIIGQPHLRGWLVEVPGGSVAYDVFIHDRYFIVNPAVLLVNFLSGVLLTYGALWLWRQLSRGRHGGAGA